MAIHRFYPTDFAACMKQHGQQLNAYLERFQNNHGLLTMSLRCYSGLELWVEPNAISVVPSQIDLSQTKRRENYALETQPTETAD